MPNSRRNVFDLKEDIQHYINLSVATATKQTYDAGERSFVTFVNWFKKESVEQYLPADEVLLTEYVAYLAKTIKYSSIKTYLAAVRHYHIRHGFQLNMHKMSRLYN